MAGETGEAMSERRTLADLLGPGEVRLIGPDDRVVSGVAYDSRQVRPGNVFVAVPGLEHDGLDFVPEAVRRGAVAVVAESDPAALPAEHRRAAREVTWARVPDARSTLARLACVFHGHPSRELVLAGVTGTNGKTTTTALLEAIFAQRGLAGRWSTTALRIAGEERPTARTTPEAPDLQGALRRMVEAGVWAAALEVSSHALALHRTDGTLFDAAVFTNLSPDHLDFHRHRRGYLEAKARLFRDLQPDALAVLNADDPAAATLSDATMARVVGWGWSPRARPSEATDTWWNEAEHGDTSLSPAYRIVRYGYGVDGGTTLELEGPRGPLELHSPLIGPANAENVAAAAVTALELGLAAEEVGGTLAGFAGVPGRLQPVDVGQPFAVLVDYAHTPAALEAALVAARQLVSDGALTVVFGCGGDRDRAKRPGMGEVAGRLADRVVVTSDNPRSEDPEAIIREIVEGVPAEAMERLVTEVDRRDAIEAALAAAGRGDCVLIAGKGHETEQVFRDRSVPFDDREVARRCLAASSSRSSGQGVSR